MNDDTQPVSLDEILGTEPAKPKRRARAAKPAPVEPIASAEPVMIDTATEVRYVDWRCKCDNTNTHALTRCGKCHSPRYITN